MAGPGAGWVRVEPGPCTCHYPPHEHDRWEIKNPRGDGRNYLVTDAVIRTYGRRHVEKLIARLPRLPERAWEADVLVRGGA
jgi:hypothetical protein